jgi:hypothetical protein
MSLFHPLLVVGLGTLVGAGGVIAFNVARSRRAARRRARRDQLVALARRTNLDFVGHRVRPEDLEDARWFRGQSNNITPDGFLQGQDRLGRFWLTRREVAGQSQEVLGFRIRGELSVGSVWYEPLASDTSGSDTSWVKRWLTRSDSRPAPSPVVRWAIHREAAPGQIIDENARNSIDRWANRLVARVKNEGRLPLGLEIANGKGWVFSTRPLDGNRVQDFLELAFDLRGAVLQEVQRRPATISRPVQTLTAEADTRERAETQPMFAVEVSESADLDDDAKTVVLSAQDLLREPPAPKRQKKKSKKFEIPEPEEDVEVIWAR